MQRTTIFSICPTPEIKHPSTGVLHHLISPPVRFWHLDHHLLPGANCDPPTTSDGSSRPTAWWAVQCYSPISCLLRTLSTNHHCLGSPIAESEPGLECRCLSGTRIRGRRGGCKTGQGKSTAAPPSLGPTWGPWKEHCCSESSHDVSYVTGGGLPQERVWPRARWPSAEAHPEGAESWRWSADLTVAQYWLLLKRDLGSACPCPPLQYRRLRMIYANNPADYRCLVNSS